MRIWECKHAHTHSPPVWACRHTRCCTTRQRHEQLAARRRTGARAAAGACSPPLTPRAAAAAPPRPRPCNPQPSPCSSRPVSGLCRQHSSSGGLLPAPLHSLLPSTPAADVACPARTGPLVEECSVDNWAAPLACDGARVCWDGMPARAHGRTHAGPQRMHPHPQHAAAQCHSVGPHCWLHACPCSGRVKHERGRGGGTGQV